MRRAAWGILWFLLIVPTLSLAQTSPTCAQLQGEFDAATVRYAQTLSTIPAARDRYDEAQQAYNEYLASVVLHYAESVTDISVTPHLATMLLAAEQLRRAMLSAEAALEAIFVSLLEQEPALLALSDARDAACAGQAAAQAGNATTSASGGGARPTIVAQTGTGTQAAQPATDQPGTDGVAAGFWFDNFDNDYYSDGSDLYNVPGGELALHLTCGGHGTNTRGKEGTLCHGPWYHSDNTFGGSFEGVAFIRRADDEPRLEGLYSNGTAALRDDWTFGMYTDQEVADRGLTAPPVH